MKKLRGLSLFANVGVAEALFDTIDVEILIANEIDEKRAQFYQELYPNTKMISGDITKKEVQTEIIQLAQKEKINFIMATPPCQGMSEAGKRNEFDERNQLIVQTIELINQINPDFIFIENVPTILKTKIVVNGEIIKIPDYVKSELSKNYNLNKETLVRAMDHGVPQMRSRNIFLAVKKELKITWIFPQKEEIITLKKAFKDIPSIDPLLREGLDFTIKKFPNFLEKRDKGLLVSKWHKPPVHSWKQVKWMLHTPSATSAIYNDEYFPQKDNGVRIKAHHNNYRRMDWNKPSRTMTQNNGVISSLCCVHPGNKIKTSKEEYIYSDPRVLTIYELLVVSSLPFDWAIPDWANDNFIRKVIGEGIPPLLVKKILMNLLKEIK
jgi:DNA (cytosine-5)-methyltransferase 1